ncbi:hypothetical protein ACOMHN_020096 [Nucella lapillus]
MDLSNPDASRWFHWSVQHLFHILRLLLRRRKHYVQLRALTIYNLVKTAFPLAKLRKNKRKKVVAIVNCIIKPDFLQFAEISPDDDEEAVAAAVPVDKVSCREVVTVLRHQLEKEDNDPSLADRLAVEEIDDKALLSLTENHLRELFPDLKIGQRIKFMGAIKATIAELQKPPELTFRKKKAPQTPQKLETFRQFDCRAKATGVYEKGHVLPEEQSRPGYLLQPVHKYCTTDDGKYDAELSSGAGQIVGIQVDKQQCELAITEEIYQAFYEDQREMALQCIRDPVYIPVVGEGAASAQLFVVEIDVVPHSAVVLKEAFIPKSIKKDKTVPPVLFRYIDGAPTKVTGKEFVQFMEAKELSEEISEDRIKQLKKLYHKYEKPMRRLEDEQIQLKEDSCYQYSPGYATSIRDRSMFVHRQDFGKDDDRSPHVTSEEEACEYRRRRVKRKDNRFAKQIPLESVLDWTHELYDKSKHDVLPYLEAYLYLVMFNWPTEWRNCQHFELFPCSKIKDVIKEWKEAFEKAHPAQKEEEGKKDRRKGTTLFFLGQGDGFDEIVFYSELQGFNHRYIGDSIWDSKVTRERLKQLKGTLLHGGSKISVTLISQKGSATQLIIPTSYPIKDHSLWQKTVRFVLGFCWSGPTAYSVTRDDSRVDLKTAHTPPNINTNSKRYENSQQKQLSEQAVEEFWKHYSDNQVQLEQVEKDLRLCTIRRQKKDLEQMKKNLEKERETLLQKRTSVLQGPD